jgi:hypothetical protein
MLAVRVKEERGVRETGAEAVVVVVVVGGGGGGGRRGRQS